MESWFFKGRADKEMLLVVKAFSTFGFINTTPNLYKRKNTIFLSKSKLKYNKYSKVQ